MTDEKKWEIVLNLLTVLRVAIVAVPEAKAFYDKMLAALKDGITADEWDSLLAERDAALDSLIAKTEA